MPKGAAAVKPAKPAAAKPAAPKRAAKRGGSGAGAELTAETYDAFRKGAKGAAYVVLHKMDGCVYCQMVQPAWDEAVGRFGRGARIASMRYDHAWVPEEAADVRGFPTIRAYRDGKANSEYRGDRSADSIAAFIKEAMLSASGAKSAAKPSAKRSAKA